MSDGWRCPSCGSVYAPWVPSCGRCPVFAATSSANTAIAPCEHRWVGNLTGTGGFRFRCMYCGIRPEWGESAASMEADDGE